MKEMYKGVVNSPETTITNDISNTDTLIYVFDDTRLPNDLPNLMTIGTGTNAETIKVISKTGSALTVVRGFQGTAKAWPTGAIIARNFTEYDYNALIENIDTLREDTDINKDDILDLMSYIGDLESLDTDEKANIVLALNEIYQDLKLHKADNVKHITTTERNTWNAKETPSGAQTKANAAANTVQQDLNNHKAESATIKHKAKEIGLQDTNNNFTAVDVEGAMSELFTNVSDGKTLIAGAITDKGVSTQPSDAFNTMANNIMSLAMLEIVEALSVESPNYGGYIDALTADNDYIYCGGHTTQKVWRIRKSDMTKVSESSSYGGIISALTADNDYIYCGGYTTQKVWKIRKSDMTKVSESPNYGGYIEALTADNDYIYCGGKTQKVWRIRKSDMTKVSESPSYGGDIRALTADNDYIYCGGKTTQKVWKIRKSDMTKVSESPNYGGYIYALTADNDYIYCGGDTQKVWRIRKSDMTKVSESSSYNKGIYALTADNDYIYCGGDTQKVWKIRKSDMTKVSESPSYGGDIVVLTADNDYIYCGGYTTQKVWKINNILILQDYYKYNDLILVPLEV